MDFDTLIGQIKTEFEVTRSTVEAKGNEAKTDVQKLFDMTKTWADGFEKKMQDAVATGDFSGISRPEGSKKPRMDKKDIVV